MRVLSFVNGGTSTSFPVELAAKMNARPSLEVEIASFYDDDLRDVDPDVRDLDIDIHPLGATSRVDANAYRQLRHLLHDVDILHTHYNAAGSLGRLAAAGTGVSIINTEHNDHRHFSHLQNLVNCPTYPLADAVVVNSESTRNSLRWYEKPFLRSTEVRTIYNGIDFGRVRSGMNRNDLPELPDGPKIVTACRIDEQKDLITLVEAMEAVVEEVPAGELIVIGDGPEKARVVQRVEELDIAESVTFLGYLPEREQVYGTIAKCDVFVVTSIYEGFCNAAVEAMGCGLPVVASDIEVLREVIGESGGFASVGDPVQFADQITMILGDGTLRNRLSEKAEDRAHEEFRIEKTVVRYDDLYKEIVKDHVTT